MNSNDANAGNVDWETWFSKEHDDFLDDVCDVSCDVGA